MLPVVSSTNTTSTLFVPIGVKRGGGCTATLVASLRSDG